MEARWFEILVGGSGKWVAREVFNIWGNGRAADKTDYIFAGHAPRVSGQREIIFRQLTRQATQGESAGSQRLGGGSIIEATLKDGAMVNGWDGIPYKN